MQVLDDSHSSNTAASEDKKGLMEEGTWSWNLESDDPSRFQPIWEHYIRPAHLNYPN